MAVDTALKRYSMLGFGSGRMLPIPDSSFTQPDRQILVYLYSGIAVDAPVEITFEKYNKPIGFGLGLGL